MCSARPPACLSPVLTVLIRLGCGGPLSPTVIALLAFDFLLKFGAEEACIISQATGEEACGRIIDQGESGCVLSDTQGWVC